MIPKEFFEEKKIEKRFCKDNIDLPIMYSDCFIKKYIWKFFQIKNLQ